LLFGVYEEMRPLYLQWGLDIPAANGDDTWELPVPATYVIDSSGRVHTAFVEKDYTKRMEPSDIVKALKSL
ncbi:MAG: AhpC/TSA family protein, partial [Gammaproteobacteria bacterium]|nr:AhpC/TSA family protein [Gammaproteobacteria bacterium]